MENAASQLKKISKFQLLVIVVVVLLLIVLVVFLLNRGGSQKAGSDSQILVTIAGKDISQTDLDSRVSRKYDPNYITSEVKTRELELLIEERLLEEEAKTRNITIAAQPISKSYYGQLRRALFPESVRSVEAYVISYDATRATNAVKATLSSQEQQAFSVAVGELELGGSPMVIAGKLVMDYPQFANYLVVNGVNYSEAIQAEAMPPAQRIDRNTAISGIDVSEILSMRENQVGKWSTQSPQSAVIVRVLSVDLSTEYADWLAQQTQGVKKQSEY